MAGKLIDELRWKKFPVLDQGHVSLCDHMGSDADICSAARTSFGLGTRPVSDDRTLIRYLARRREMAPFEHAILKFHLRIPMDVARQMFRYRTASISEYSTRYSEAIDAMQATPPDGWRKQATDNKQGSGGAVTEWPEGWAAGDAGWGVSGPDRFRLSVADDDISTPGKFLSYEEAELQSRARAVYRRRLSLGVAREQARKDLPLSTYTEAVFTINLRNMLHVCGERMPEKGPQREIREVVTTIGREIVAPLFPMSWEAFEDYTLGAMTLSATEILGIRRIILGSQLDPMTADLTNRREQAEFIEKITRLGFLGMEVND